MSLSRVGGRVSRGLVAGALGRPAALLFAVALSAALGACSSGGAFTQSANWSTALAPVTGAGTTPPPPAGPAIEIEGDGIETQRAPRRTLDKAPDDPREPFSPNYGAVPAAEAVPERA
jgi:hypothetical protein